MRESKGEIAEGRQVAITIASIGYGIVCGLVFPLMVQSIFLQEIGLSHGAGESFGLMFFAAYTLTMLLAAAIYGLAESSGTGLKPVAAGLALAFLGNGSMLLHTLGLVQDGRVYATVTAGLVGCGLALAELGWTICMSAISAERPMQLARAVSGAYLIGCVTSVVIFGANGAYEIAFALLVIGVSTLLGPVLLRKRVTVPDDTEGDRRNTADLVRAMTYLAIFSFVFGAAGQAGAASASGFIPVEAQALLGMLVAAAASIAASMATRKVLPVTDLNTVFFPLVAVALVALPFVTTSGLREAVLVLLFASFFFAGINARITVCQIGWSSSRSRGLTGSAVLGVGGLSIILGVLMGSMVLEGGDLRTELAFISMVSLFALSMVSFLYREFQDRRKAATADESGPFETEVDVPSRLSRRSAPLAENIGLTGRESDVLELICQGRTRAFIAAELGISPNTVKGYTHAIYQKAGVDNKQDLLDLLSQAEGSQKRQL